MSPSKPRGTVFLNFWESKGAIYLYRLYSSSSEQEQKDLYFPPFNLILSHLRAPQHMQLKWPATKILISNLDIQARYGGQRAKG